MFRFCRVICLWVFLLLGAQTGSHAGLFERNDCSVCQTSEGQSSGTQRREESQGCSLGRKIVSEIRTCGLDGISVSVSVAWIPFIIFKLISVRVFLYLTLASELNECNKQLPSSETNISLWWANMRHSCEQAVFLQQAKVRWWGGLSGGGGRSVKKVSGRSRCKYQPLIMSLLCSLHVILLCCVASCNWSTL